MALGIVLALDGFPQRTFGSDVLRTALLAPVMIMYVLIAQNIQRGARERVLRDFGLLLDLKENDYASLLMQLSHLTPLGEAIAFGIGVAIGLWVPLSSGFEPFWWTRRFIFASSLLMFGTIAWSLYVSFAVTRLINALHLQPLQFNIFDPTFLKPIARRSLNNTFVIIGAITLTILLLPNQAVQSLQFIALISILLLFTLLNFFLSLQSSHQLMMATKQHELEMVRRHLADEYQTLKNQQAANSDAITAWLAYEARIERVPEWLFNTETIRDLGVSVLVPSATFFIRLLIGR